MILRNAGLGATLVALLLAPAAAAPTAGQEHWQLLAAMDLEAMAQAIKARHIFAVSPGAEDWLRLLDSRLASARTELPLVTDFPGYRAVLQHFAVSFHDAHLRLNFALQETSVDWPGFLARYQAGQYRVTHSVLPGVAGDAVITGCDGKPVQDWVEKIAGLEIGLPASLVSTRADAAAKIFVDRRNPLYKRPVTCIIGGKPVTLSWRSSPVADIAPYSVGRIGYHESAAFIRPLPGDGAWIRLGYFAPNSVEQADAFLKVIDQAKTTRNKRYVVLDVRGNPGGPYNWFMAFLRGLYGPAYADYYATARLHIRALYRVTPDILAIEGQAHATDLERKQPPDPPREVVEEPNAHAKALARGANYYEGPATPFAKRGPPPPNPVTARIIVLTDTGCGSACIAFLDEIKLFPGVIQAGTDSYVDSRTGTPMSSPLPSGNATLLVPTMTRVGRERDDNVSQRPDIAYGGDMSDTAAVLAWVSSIVDQQPAAAAHP